MKWRKRKKAAARVICGITINDNGRISNEYTSGRGAGSGRRSINKNEMEKIIKEITYSEGGLIKIIITLKYLIASVNRAKESARPVYPLSAYISFYFVSEF